LNKAILESDEQSLNIGTISLLGAFAISMISYISGTTSFYYLSFALILLSLFYMFYFIKSDLDNIFNSSLYSISLIILFITLYIVQRLEVSDSSFITGDASDYYWAGVSSVLKGDDIGFFLPLTSAISAIGYKIFGLANLAFIIVIVHLAVMPIYYFLFRKIGINQIVSLLLIFLVQMVPLDIWFSKITFSEPIWQVLFLLLIYLSYKIIDSDKFSYSTYIAFFMLIATAPLSRGSAVFVYGVIYFLTLYSFWKYGKFRLALTIISSILLLTISIEYILPIREKYLIGWQYSRILPSVDIKELVYILYTITLLFILSLFAIRWRERLYRPLNLGLILTIISILLKIAVAYLFAIKKDIPFLNLFILNEFGLARVNLNIILISLILFGLGYIYYLAAFKRDRLALLIVILYTLFSIPFVMQNVTTLDQHDMFIYWHRYYFSELFVVHILSLAIVVKILYQIGDRFKIRESIFISIFSLIVASAFLYSISLPLHNLVTKEASLSHSSDIFDWISDRAKGRRLTVVYDSDIHYGVYNAEQLIYRGLYVTGVDIQKYIRLPKESLDSSIKFSKEVINGDQILCLSTTSCNLDEKQFVLVDRFSTSLWWRRSGGAIEKEMQHLNIYAYLYDIKHQFSVGSEVHFTNSSDIAHKLLSDGWYSIGQEAVWSSNHAKISIPNIFQKGSKYKLEMRFGLYHAQKSNPKRLTISIGDDTISDMNITQMSPSLYSINLPNKYIDNLGDKTLLIDFDIPKAVSPYEIRYSKDRRRLGISLYSLKIVKIQE